MTFSPDRSTITNITQAVPAVVTTNQNHGLFNGNVVRLNVPKTYGMFQLNNIPVQVVPLSPTTFSCWYMLVPQGLPVDSRSYPGFVTPTNPGFVASVIPMGSGPTPKTDTQWQITNNFADTPLTDTFYNNSTVEIPFGET